MSSKKGKKRNVPEAVTGERERERERERGEDWRWDGSHKIMMKPMQHCYRQPN